MAVPKSYGEWAERATGNRPYAYQSKLAAASAPPSFLAIPTGCGKTQAVLAAWMYQRSQGLGPRRLVYALPMRSLVEQTRDVALAMRKRSRLNPEELPITVLMGGEEHRQGDWRLRPEVDQVLIGTIDMLLSRALNRGYGESRFAWPISFGLLNSDCRWVFDEVQLMGPARTTSAQLDGLRATLGTSLPCETMWVSATVAPEALATVDRQSVGEILSLPPSDRRGPLRRRLQAEKTLERIDLTAVEQKDLPKAIAATAVERHQPGTRTLVVLNRVARAQQAFAELRKLATGDAAARTILLHSRFRPPDREAHLREVFEEPGTTGTIVVSTQVIEAGADLSSRTLLTETAPFSSIVQRLGRCNRDGETAGSVVWLDPGEVEDTVAGRKLAAPYLPHDLSTARSTLLGLVGRSLSPAVLEQVERVPETPDDSAVLRRSDLIDLFDTSPDLSGMDIDVAPFIREDDERSAFVFFRRIDGRPTRIENEPLPRPAEVVQVPRQDLERRDCWVVDHVTGAWERRPGREVSPGATAMLAATDGGYTSTYGWDPEQKATVVANPPAGDQAPEGVEFEIDASVEQELLGHLEETRSEAIELVERLGFPSWSEALVAAASLHDLGKAHPEFQRTMRKALEIDDGDTRTWAKSGERSGRHRRRHLRHELASALVLRALDGEIGIPDRALVIYLVAAHHGRVRLSIRPAPGETQPDAGGDRFALGIVEGETLPAVETPLGTIPATALSLECMELGANSSWVDAAASLRDDAEIGPFRLAFLEAILRVTDWRASA